MRQRINFVQIFDEAIRQIDRSMQGRYRTGWRERCFEKPIRHQGYTPSHFGAHAIVARLRGYAEGIGEGRIHVVSVQFLVTQSYIIGESGGLGNDGRLLSSR